MYFIHYVFDACKLLYYLSETEGIGKVLYARWILYPARTGPQWSCLFEKQANSRQELLRLLQKRGYPAMKLSTRNVIKGKVVEVKEGTVAAKVRVDIGGGNTILSTITVDAVRELGLKVGDEVFALIKASSVMIMKE
jgi:molybdopterin-binding protein